MEDTSRFYELWFDFVTLNGQVLPTEKMKIDITQVCDERGYVIGSIVVDKFQTIFDTQLKKKFA